ncbi:hypothetical protein [Carboxylicivirga sp. RSCT41]|uniref:hypothetical protein n=1 Tax=Carboxylicivirga agarovorans TaxID=3417570 RepID=UPI003D346319
MKYILLLAVLLACANSSDSQTVKAITQHGETVVLYENGTWKYEKDVNQSNSTQINTTSPATVTVPVAPAVAVAKVEIDASKDVTAEKIEIYNAVSKKLSHFFGDEKGRVRCSATASNNKGKISLNFEFMMQVGDANRYFGYTTKDRTMTLELTDGSKITTTFTENFEEKFIEKWNVSYYKASVVLSEDDVTKLLQSNTMRMTIDWKKLEEEYQIDKVDGIKSLLNDVI